MRIGSRHIGPGSPCYVIAEMSANHGGSLDAAVRVVRAARDAGADAVKTQTYEAGTMTLASSLEHFRIRGGGIGEGRLLYDLYDEAHMPWEWHAVLRQTASDCGLDFFSTAYDACAVDFLERLGVPVYKIASFELVDLPLLRRVAATGKPVILSTGMATDAEIDEALDALGPARSRTALLKCTTAYPAPAGEMNLRTIPDMQARFGVPVGLSDHTMVDWVPVAAIALGACIVEKHLTLSRADGGPDSGFSLEPHEFKMTVDAIRGAEAALGSVCYEPTPAEQATRVFRRSLYVVEDLQAGGVLTAANLKIIRPGHGLHPRHYDGVLGRRVTRAVRRGTALDWELLQPLPRE